MTSKARHPLSTPATPAPGGTLSPNLSSDPQEPTGPHIPVSSSPSNTPLHQSGNEPVLGYQLVKRLGQGGFGEVWQAIGPGGFPVAMKFIRLGAPSGDIELRSLELMKTIRHPNLLGQFGAWQQEETLIIAMELAEGTLLNRHAAAIAEGLPGIPAEELLEYMADAARGIDYLNEPRPEDGQPHGIQHRDIKPANLLLVGGCVKVADFGLAKVLQNSVASNTGSMTLAYAAPECINGSTSERSDQYSLAISYCHLRGNRLPYRGTAQQVMFGHLMKPPDLTMLPEAEQTVVARALAKNSEQRWPNCRAFVNALAPAARAQPGPVVAPRGRKSDSKVTVQPVRDLDPTPRLRRQTTEPGPTRDRLAISFLGLLVVTCISFWVCISSDKLSYWASEVMEWAFPPKVEKVDLPETSKHD